MKKIGNVEIPREAFYKFLSTLIKLYGFHTHTCNSNTDYWHI